MLQCRLARDRIGRIASYPYRDGTDTIRLHRVGTNHPPLQVPYLCCAQKKTRRRNGLGRSRRIGPYRIGFGLPIRVGCNRIVNSICNYLHFSMTDTATERQLPGIRDFVGSRDVPRRRLGKSIAGFCQGVCV
jgi:hypothetical protein